MSENKRIPGYVPLTTHSLEKPQVYDRAEKPYYKFMSIEDRVRKCQENFGLKKQGKPRNFGYNKED